MNQYSYLMQRQRELTPIYVRAVSAQTSWLNVVRDFPPMDRNIKYIQSNAAIKKCCTYDELIVAWIQEPLWT